VLQTRTFQRLGDTTTKEFRGKIVAATNRDLSREMSAGRFRADFYYRLCSDLISTPTLREQLDGAPDDLHDLIGFITHRIAGEAEEAEAWPARRAPGSPATLGPITHGRATFASWNSASGTS